MTTSIVSTTINHGVIPGYKGYGTNLTITGSGVINGATYAVYGTSLLGSVYIVNAGLLSATELGVVLVGLAGLDNSGSIAGGLAGVFMKGGGLSNTGVIIGGTIGALVSNADLPVSNSGIITGGTIGLYGQNSAITNFGSIAGTGIGALLIGGTFSNASSGVVTGENSGIGLAGEKGATIRNAGTVSGIPEAAGIYGTGTFYNSGVINGLGIGFYLRGTSSTALPLLSNQGIITAFNDGVDAIGGEVRNSGTLYGEQAGIALSGGTLINPGLINGSTFGVSLSGGLLDNSGFIHGSTGVLIAGGTLDESGTISGDVYAVKAQGNVTLELAGSARITGLVDDISGDGLLELSGSGSIGGVLNPVSGFSTIDFGAGAAWTLEASVAGLAGTPQINGFALGDTLVLDGFAATSDARAAGGLILENGLTGGSVSISGDFLPQQLSFTSSGGSTTIALAELPVLSIVSSLLAGGIDMNTAYVARTVTVTSSGTVENYITGSYDSTIINSGLVSGEISGVYKIFNVDGTITSGNIAVAPGELGAVYNTGLISGQYTGVAAFKAQMLGVTPITNSGTIIGGVDGAIEYGGTVIDSGLMAGGDYALYNSSVYEYGTNKDFFLNLTVMPGARFDGKVEDKTGAGLLNLAGSTAGSIDIGSSFSGFSLINFASDVSWSLEGAADDLASGETITGFALGDTITLDAFSAASYSYVSGTGLVLSNGTTSATLGLAGNFATSDFTVLNEVDGVAVVDGTPAPCFCAGTRIATSRGNIAVEKLQIGELVRTAAHGFQPIRWIGRRSYDGRFIAGNHLALPVRIRRHALGFNVPSRDLFMSPDHALCEGGVLVHAWRLVNGVSVTQAESVERVEYFHVELDRHAVIFAENAPVESFLDAGCRNRFENALSAPAESAAQTPCLPRVEEGYYLARLKARIDARAGIAAPAGAPGFLRGCIDEAGATLRGWAQDEAAPEMPVELELLCGGRAVMRFLANRYRADLRAAGLGSGCHAFAFLLPAPGAEITLRRVSDGALLAEAQGWMATRRAG